MHRTATRAGWKTPLRVDRKPITARDAFTRSAWRGALKLAIAAAVLLPLSTNAMRADADPDLDPRPQVTHSPAALVEAHQCWTGAAPVGATAHHAVVTPRGAERPVYVTAGPALEQQFGGVDHDLIIHAFCR